MSKKDKIKITFQPDTFTEQIIKICVPTLVSNKQISKIKKAVEDIINAATN